MPEGFSSNDETDDRPESDGVSANEQSDRVSRRRRLLLIDDNPQVAEAMRIAMLVAEHDLDVEQSAEEAFSRLSANRYDAIILDLNFSAGRTDGKEGLACLARIMASDPRACVLVLTAHSGIRIAVAAMQAGARDFIMKPWRNGDLIAKVEAAIARPITSRTVPSSKMSADDNPIHLLGESQAMTDLRDIISRTASTNASVAVTGPSGSGRNLIATALHTGSRHAGTPIVKVDLRDELSWERLSRATGTLLVRAADHLDGIQQARILDHIPTDCRLISIVDTLDPLMPALRYRVATIEIAVPPLHMRGTDALLLARHFARQSAERHGRAYLRFTEAAEAMIMNLEWLDQVRGLQMAVERAVILSDGGVIDASLLPGKAATSLPEVTRPHYDLVLNERAMIIAALREHHHNVTRAAGALGLSRAALYRRMTRHGL
jgi:DNA-binding NtrC family response regulator